MGGKAPLSDFWWDEFLCPSKLSSPPLISIQSYGRQQEFHLSLYKTLLSSTSKQVVFLNSDADAQLKQSKIHQVSWSTGQLSVTLGSTKSLASKEKSTPAGSRGQTHDRKVSLIGKLPLLDIFACLSGSTKTRDPTHHSQVCWVFFFLFLCLILLIVSEQTLAP